MGFITESQTRVDYVSLFDEQIDNKHNTLNNLMQGLNIHNEINNKVDIKQDIDDISSSEEDDDEDFKLF